MQKQTLLWLILVFWLWLISISDEGPLHGITLTDASYIASILNLYVMYLNIQYLYWKGSK